MPPAMTTLVLDALERIVHRAELAPYLPPVDFTQAIFGWARGGEAPRSLFDAILYYYLGLHLLDDVHDGDLEPGIDEHLATTTALACITAMPAVALRDRSERSSAGSAIAVEFQLQTLPCTAGQFIDVDRRGPVVLSAAHRVLELRNGAMGRLLGRVAALAAGARPDEVDAAGSLVANLYIASQIVDDVDELLNRAVSSDARNLSKTLPLCYALEAAPEGREQVLRLCREGRAQGHRRLRELLGELGAFDYGLEQARAYLERGRDDLRLLESRWGRATLYRDTVACIMPEAVYA